MREVLELRQANRMRGHDQVIAAQLMLARAESACGNEAEARAQLEAAVAATAVRSGARSAAVGDVYINVAQTLAVLERDMEAATRAEEGLRVLREAAAPREDVLAGRISVGSLLLDLGVTERAGELSAAALEAARAVAGERRTYARAAELAARVAIATRDLDGASAIASERLASLSEVAGMSPRLLVDSHWLLAEIAEERDDLPEALAQVEQARMPNAHGSNATPAQIALREAELNLRLEHYPKAVRLADELQPPNEDSGSTCSGSSSSRHSGQVTRQRRPRSSTRLARWQTTSQTSCSRPCIAPGSPTHTESSAATRTH